MHHEEIKSIKIQLVHQLIGKQFFDIEPRDNLSEFRSTLAQFTPLALYENYHFQRNNKKLSEYQEAAQVFQIEPDSFSNLLIELRVVMEPFDDRSSRYHFAKVKKILDNPIIWAVLTNKQSDQKPLQTMLPQSENLQSSITDLEAFLERPITSALIQLKASQKFPELVKSLNYSGFNSPPYYRKLAGDFYYLHLSTLQGTDYHITANPEGFFLNNSTGLHFNPSPHTSLSRKTHCFTSLLDLLMSVSQKFHDNFLNVIKNLQVTQVDRMMSSSLFSLSEQQPLNLWIKETNRENEVHFWSNQSSTENSLKQVDPNAIKDWNELFQMQSVLPSETVIDRLNKQKLKFKLYQQLAQFAKTGAMSIVEEKILPMSANTIGNSLFSYASLRKSHVYTIGSLLFTISQESPYSYSTNKRKNIEGDAAPTGKQADNSLKNLAIIEQMAIPELHLAHMVVVKYRGFKIVVESIIPGAMQSDFLALKHQIEGQQTYDSIKQLCRSLQISEQQSIIGDSKSGIKKFVCAPHLKILRGNDKRKYLSDLNKLSPRDYNYLGSQNQNCVLRHQILQIYKEKQKCNILLNPVLGTNLKIQQSQQVKCEQQKLRSIAKFAKEIVVPMFIDSICNSMRKHMSDTKGVMFVVHKMGLGSRYLGSIYDQATDQEHPHLKMVIQRVIIVKTLKNIFRLAMREADLLSLKTILVRMLNCVFGSHELQKAMEQEDSEKNDSEKDGSQESTANTYKKKKKKVNRDKEKDDCLLQFAIPQKPSKYLYIRPSQFWQIVKKVALIRYSHKLPDKIEDFGGFSPQFKFNKLATLRDLCLHLGLVLDKKQYLSPDWRMFLPNDILEFKALCKHIPIECKDLSDTIEEGDKFTAKCQVEEAVDCYNKAMQYIMANFGGLHEKLAMVHKKLSNIYFRIGQIQTALLFANHSCHIFEFIYGADHIQTIENYTLLAFYHFSKKNFQIAELLLLKSIHLHLANYGECYPELIVGYLNLSTIYQSQKKYTDAIMSVVSGLNLAIKIFGYNHINVAICYSALAALHYEIPDIQQSIKYQTKAVETLSQILREEDSRVKESKAVLEYYKTLQNTKKIKEMHQKQQKKIDKLYSGMQLFKLPEPTLKQKEEFLMKMNKLGKKKSLF